MKIELELTNEEMFILTRELKLAADVQKDSNRMYERRNAEVCNILYEKINKEWKEQMKKEETN